MSKRIINAWSRNTLLQQFCLVTRLLSLLILWLYLPQVLANNILLSPIIDLAGSFEANVYWNKPLPNPKNGKQYYIVNSKGQLHLINDNYLEKTPIVNIQQYYQDFSSFDALALHPNFAINHQKGYNTFYTAHVEPINSTKRTLRIKDKNLTNNFPYEAVIVEWKINEVNSLKVDPDSKREILRIGVNQAKNAINDMRFNPYIKSWNDNFSHLYFALAFDKTLKQSPLYSGAILRINPEKFGLRSYTTPNNNPFINQAEVPDELLIIGIQQIEQFIWQKSNHQQLIVAHLYDQQPLLSQVNYGDNYIGKAPETQLNTGNAILADESLTLYRGREFRGLRNKLLFMSKQEGQWQLQSLETSPPFQKTVVNVFSNNELAAKEQFSLFTDTHDELLLFSKNQHVIQQLVYKPSITINKEDESTINELPPEASNEVNESYLIWFIVILLGGVAVWFAKNKKGQNAVKSLLHKNYARFELSVDNRQLSLFNRHQQNAALTLDINTITRCDILLNDEHLLSIDKGISGFDPSLEQVLDTKFDQEKRNKMVDHRTRKIELNITDNQGIIYGLCLYLREGNQRLTKAKYGQVTDELKEWCWFISAELSPEKTGKRVVKIVQPAPDKPKPVVKKSTPRQSIPEQPISAVVDSETSENISIIKTSTESQPQVDEVPPKKLQRSPKSLNNTNNSSNHDAQLIEALRKLANLKAQGYLTEDEFVTAKAKILADLQDN